MTIQPLERPRLGVAYYPEHWPESRWQEDARQLREAGITVARMMEFAWDRLEPSRAGAGLPITGSGGAAHPESAGRDWRDPLWGGEG